MTEPKELFALSAQSVSMMLEDVSSRVYTRAYGIPSVSYAALRNLTFYGVHLECFLRTEICSLFFLLFPAYAPVVLRAPTAKRWLRAKAS